MGGQVLGGGIVVLVAVVLWLVYLLPSWYSRHQFDAAERNAVRLNQALRVLAETSETPDEVRLELNARTALAQQKVARKAQSEREEAARRAQAERDALAKKTLDEREQAELALRRAELERARAERVAASRQPEVRRARARRRLRLTATVIGLAGLGLAGWGAVVLAFGPSATGAAPALVGTGGALAAASALVLVRMSRVGARAAVRAVAPIVATPRRVVAAPQDVSLEDERAWRPRELPRPLTASAGSRAAALLDAAAAREQLRQAALDDALRERAEQARPPELDTARLARMGHVDDAEIEAHVRTLLRQRAAG
nr:large exoprotein [Microbacterium bovistercoris]